MSQFRDSYCDWLDDLYNIGLILVATTVLPGAVALMFAILTSRNLGVDGGAYAIGAMINSGLIIMGYATVKMRRRRRLLQKVANV